LNTGAPKDPLFSIITVCYNSEQTISRTIASIDGQTFGDWEHIIIDGASTDNTLSIALDSASPKRKVYSEPDNGIFDAMNKGISHAKGRYLCFLNSDDALTNANVLERTSNFAKQDEFELLYGNATIIDEGNYPITIGKMVEAKDYIFGTPIIHQAVFFRRDLFERYGMYDLNVQGGAADWIWLAKYFRMHLGKTKYLNETIVDFYRGGASNRFVWENHLERIRFAYKYLPYWAFATYIIGAAPVFLKFRVLRLHKDTWFRRCIRNFKRKVHCVAMKF